MDSLTEQLTGALIDTLKEEGITSPRIILEHPDTIDYGDYTTNVALIYSKDFKQKPFLIAEKIVAKLREKNISHIEKIDIAGPGFINITLDRTFFSESVRAMLGDKKIGQGDAYKSKKVIVEYTDPNPFKQFHIGHLMSNTIGESISRLIESQGAKLKRACYQGDVGLHVALTLWGVENILKNTFPKYTDSLAKKVEYLSKAYSMGRAAYDESDLSGGAIGPTKADLKREIDEINKKVYSREDKKLNDLYDWGRKVSLEYFDEIYKKLGTDFDYKFFESQTGTFGREVVEKNVGKIFEKSEGAIIFKGEEYGLHTRVFINSQGLPTYEAKELGLAKIKYDAFKYDKSIVITGNEVNDYFKVLLKVMSFVFPDLAQKTDHISHGMLRFASGKMSSRKGNVISAESLLKDIERLITEKMTGRDFDKKLAEKVTSQIAVGAIKYSILKQAPGGDIIFDFDKSLSFEGDSGPYLQYTAVRAGSVLEKGKSAGLKAKVGLIPPDVAGIERLLYRFPEIVSRSCQEYAPQYLTTYLTEIASAFNSWYGNTQIIDPKDPYTPYRLAITASTRAVLIRGLDLLGIEVPERM